MGGLGLEHGTFASLNAPPFAEQTPKRLSNCGSFDAEGQSCFYAGLLGGACGPGVEVRRF